MGAYPLGNSDGVQEWLHGSKSTFAGTEHTQSLGISFVVGSELPDHDAGFKSDGRIASV